jgi:RNA polymerase sigma factor (sigma-70 family)
LHRDRHEFASRTPDLPATADHPADHDQIERVMQRLAALPEDERLAIHAFYFEQQSAQTVADRLEMSRSGFYALLQRALARLAIRPHKISQKDEAAT